MKTTVVNLRREPFDVLVARPSKYGNPYLYPAMGTRRMVLKLYCQWLLSKPQLVEDARRELAGKRLGCYCAPELCHADVLAFVADGGSVDQFMFIERLK